MTAGEDAAFRKQERAFLLKQALTEVLDDEKRKKELTDLLVTAIDLWMDKKFEQFGKWTFRSLAVAAFGGMFTLAVLAKQKGLW